MRKQRFVRAPAVAVLALVAAATLAGCNGVEGQNTPNGTQLRPHEVPVPPALPGQGSEHVTNR